jgi:hypothetical protein
MGYLMKGYMQEGGAAMISTDVSSLEGLMKVPVDISMNLNDVRIIVECLRAITYFGEIEGEDYLGAEGRALKERMEGHYLEIVQCRTTLIHSSHRAHSTPRAAKTNESKAFQSRGRFPAYSAIDK